MPRQLTGNVEFHVVSQDIFTMEVDAIVLPTSTTGALTSDLGVRLKEAGGEEVEKEAMGVAPIAVGAAFVSSGGPVTAPHIIHVPIQLTLGDKVGVESIRRAARAALVAGNVKGFRTLAIPPLTRSAKSGIPTIEIARAVIDEVRGHRHPKPEKVYLVTNRASMIRAANKIISNFK